MMNTGNELKLGFKLPQHILKQDPTTNVLIKVSFGNKKREDQAIFKVEINDQQLGKTFYVFDSEVLDGSLSTFEKIIPWEHLHLSNAQNTVTVTYISGKGDVGVKDVELLLDTSVASDNQGFGDVAQSASHRQLNHQESVDLKA